MKLDLKKFKEDAEKATHQSWCCSFKGDGEIYVYDEWGGERTIFDLGEDGTGDDMRHIDNMTPQNTIAMIACIEELRGALKEVLWNSISNWQTHDAKEILKKWGLE